MLQRILDFIWAYGFGYLRMFFFMFFLTGCTAYVASPLTVPLWIIIGASFPRSWAVWRGLTAVHILAFAFVACLSYIEGNWPTFIITTVLAVVTLVLCFTRPGDQSTATPHTRGIVGVQILVAIVGLGTILTYMFSSHG